MDKKISVLNVTISIVSRIFILISAVLVRHLLIRYIGNEVNGLNALYTSIIGMLTVAELGIGRAITYSMYKPIVDEDTRKIASLYRLYKKLYYFIGIVILVMGLLVMRFLPTIISDYEEVTTDIYLTFFLALISVVLSYLYAAKIALIEAYKDNYITTGILTIGGLIRFVLQAIAIIIWRSFPVFLVCRIIETLIIWILTEIAVKSRHKSIISRHEEIDASTRQEIVRNTKAIVMHRIGTVLVNTIDNVIISSFIGVMVLGKYSNYVLISSVIAGTISLFFNPLTSVIGHLFATGDIGETKKWFDRFYFMNYVLGVVFFLGYYAVIDYAVTILFGTGLKLSRIIAFIITVNQFTAFMRRTTLLFRDASGTFYYDRWKPICEGIANLVLSLLFVQVFPEDLRIVGVIVATIITTMGICHIVDPYVVFKHAFKMPVKEYYIRNYSYIVLFTLALILMTYLNRPTDSPIIGLLQNGFISIGVSLITLGFVAIVDKPFRIEICTVGRKTMEWSRRVLHR